MNKPSIVLMGSKPAAVVALAILVERGWDVQAVVVAKNIDLSWYGGMSVAQLATQHGIRVLSPTELPRDLRVDFVVSYLFRNLVKPDVLAMARRAALNFHAAPLPAYGGWACYSLAILENLELYGCTCHHMDETFDTGPLLKVRRFPINVKQETAYSLEARAQDEMLRLFVDVCYTAENTRQLPSVAQNKHERRYLNRKQMEALKRIPDNADSETIDRYSRAFWYPPFDCAYINYNNTRVEIVPSIAKVQLGRLLHAHDLERLRASVSSHKPDLIL
jgi:methionyl-tRNA formyltransferase